MYRRTNHIASTLDSKNRSRNLISVRLWTTRAPSETLHLRSQNHLRPSKEPPGTTFWTDPSNFFDPTVFLIEKTTKKGPKWFQNVQKRFPNRSQMSEKVGPTDRSDPPFRSDSFSGRNKSLNRLQKRSPRIKNEGKIIRSDPQSDLFLDGSDIFTDRIY